MDPNTYQQYTPYINPEADQTRAKKRLTVILVSLLALLVCLGIFGIVRQYLADRKLGSLIITTNSSKNVITATSMPNNPDTEKAITTTLKSGTSARLMPGNYAVLVKGPTGTVTQVAAVKSRQTAKYSVNLPPSAASLEPVADVNALYFAVGKSNIYYLDQDQLGDTLNKINNKNQLSAVSDVAFSNISWGDATFGVGLAGNDNLFLINNGAVSQLSSPADTSGDSEYPIFSVSPDHDIYLVEGMKVYRRTPSSGWQQIYTTTHANEVPVAAVNGELALYYYPGDGPKASNDKASITILNSKGVQAQKEIEAYQVAWSPDGKHLITTVDAGTYIYNNSLSMVATIPINNVNNPVWVDNDTVLFSTNDQLWKYTMSSSSSRVELVATAQSGRAIDNIALNPDKTYAYVSVQTKSGSNDDLQIWRYGLKGQTPPSYITKLQGGLPYLQGRCLLSLTNFVGKPTILSYGGLQQDHCTNVSQSYAQQLGADPSKLTYYETNLPPDESTANL